MNNKNLFGKSQLFWLLYLATRKPTFGEEINWKQGQFLSNYDFVYYVKN